MPKPTDNIHVMPEQFFNIAATAPFETAGSKKPGTAQKKKGKWLIVFFIIVFAGLVGLSAWLLIKSYQPAQQAAPAVSTLTEEPATESTIIEPESSAIEAPTITEPESVPATEVITEEIEEFNPADLNQQPLSVIISTDTDADGLTDDEELLFDTDLNQPDTDKDGYLDGEEVVNLYNPLAKEPAQIEYSGLVATYINSNYNYKLFYPKKWLAKSVDDTSSEVMFTSVLGEFVNVLTIENQAGLTLRDWYKQQVPDALDNEIIDIKNKNGLIGLVSPDGFTVYFSAGQYIYVIHYSIGLQPTASYPHLFKMMYESFVFTGEAAEKSLGD